jgi:hypothetical protein
LLSIAGSSYSGDKMNLPQRHRDTEKILKDFDKVFSVSPLATASRAVVCLCGRFPWNSVISLFNSSNDMSGGI